MSKSSGDSFEPHSTVESTSFCEEDIARLSKAWPSSFESCQFSGMKFCEISLRGISFLDCKFERCSFSRADLQRSSFSNNKFTDCNLMGINWVTLNRFDNCEFRNCKLDYSCFQALKLKRLVCVDCSLREVDFYSTQLVEADFSGSNLAGTSFAKADLSKADFRTAKDYFIDPVVTKIKGAKFSLPDALVLLESFGAEVSF